MKKYDEEMQKKWNDAKYVATSEDWAFIQVVLNELQPNIGIEFGAGSSTLWLADTLNRLVSYETSQGWIDRLKKTYSRANIDFRTWDGINFMDRWPQKFDVAFVDGPFHAHQRGAAVQVASRLSDNVILHDWHDAPTKEFAKKYLEPAGFKLVITGGRIYGGDQVVAYFRREVVKKTIGKKIKK